MTNGLTISICVHSFVAFHINPSPTIRKTA